MSDPISPSPARLGFVRVAVISPELRVADVTFNTAAITAAMADAAGRGVRLALFPELCITGYSCADLFYQPQLLDAACAALDEISTAALLHDIAVCVGLPLAVDGKLFNCAAFIGAGPILGIVPKTYLPSTNEFYEERWFTPGSLAARSTIDLPGREVLFGTDLLFAADNLPGCVVGIEICEDLWAVSPPSGGLALAGATVLLNGSASNELLGKAAYRRDLVRQQSARCLAAYLYAGAGPGESTTDLVWAGHSLIAENGTILAETERFRFDTQMAVCDVDVQRLINERLRNNAYAAALPERDYRVISFSLPGDLNGRDGRLIRPALSRTPFVPADPEQRAAHCREIFSIQATGLAKRLRHTGSRRVTIGLSGGLDSTLALLVTVRAFDLAGLPHDGIVAITMPGFGTTARTRSNAEKLAEHLGVSFRTIPIGGSVRRHFADIGHDENLHDVTYENAQARERTQILMDVANQVGGFVVGTGDLSELALGWATYNGDHMSMYHVNAGVPKTLVRYMVDWAADAEFSDEASALLHDISATPITPELLPLDKQGNLEQKTEDAIGPYELHDFFLFQTVRYQFPPRKVYALARQAFEGSYSSEEILKWLEVFYRRFFSQQFKRSAMPDGPKVGSVALSPRGDWRMPSDASAALWLVEVEALRQGLQAVIER
jgi:NAD+ synthase (glutamine-hydrolysing)